MTTFLNPANHPANSHDFAPSIECKRQESVRADSSASTVAPPTGFAFPNTRGRGRLNV
jgi:hypothetical protein